MAVPESVPRPLVDNASANTLQPALQPVSPPVSVALPVDQQGANPGSSPDGRIIASRQGGRTCNTVTLFVFLDQRAPPSCVLQCSLITRRGESQILFLSDIALKVFVCTI